MAYLLFLAKVGAFQSLDWGVSIWGWHPNYPSCFDHRYADGHTPPCRFWWARFKRGPGNVQFYNSLLLSLKRPRVEDRCGPNSGLLVSGPTELGGPSY